MATIFLTAIPMSIISSNIFLGKRQSDGFTHCWSDLSPFTGRWCLECHGSHTEGSAW